MLNKTKQNNKIKQKNKKGFIILKIIYWEQTDCHSNTTTEIKKIICHTEEISPCLVLFSSL